MSSRPTRWRSGRPPEDVVVGVLSLTIEVPGSGSLKEKRRVLQSLMQRLRNRFRVAVAEVDHQEHHRLAAVAVAVVSTATAHANEVLSEVAAAVERDGSVVLAGYSIEMR